MKVTMYMAMTANGYIARLGSGKIIGSGQSWKRYCAMVKKFGNVIMGRKTFELMHRLKRTKGIGHPFAVAITRDKGDEAGEDFAYASTPKEALEIMARKGFKNALVCGGATTNAMFMKADLVDELFLEANPEILGNGVALFSEGSFENRLQLIGTHRESDGAVTLHYRVRK